MGEEGDARTSIVDQHIDAAPLVCELHPCEAETEGFSALPFSMQCRVKQKWQMHSHLRLLVH